jgi:hypothetical protein
LITKLCGGNSMVESQFSKLIVAGSSPVLRSEWKCVRVAD